MSINKYFWFEYQDYIKERLKSIECEINSLLVHLNHLGVRRESFVYYNELKSLLETVGKSYKDLSREETKEAEIVPELRYLFAGLELKVYKLLDVISEFVDKNARTETELKNLIEEYKEAMQLLQKLEQALTYLKYCIDQLSGGEFLKQTTFYQYSFTSPLTDMPSQEKILKAVSATVNNYSLLIFGKEWSEKHKIKPIAIAGFSDYTMYLPVYVTLYPIADTFRTRFWVGLGHEVQHEKNYVILTLKDAIEKWGKKEILIDKIRLLFVEDKNFEKWDLNWESIKTYIAREIEVSTQRSERLLDEIISDISNVLLSGPADFLPLLSGYLGSIFNMTAHLTGHHPPTFLRFEYSLKVVEEVLELKDFTNDYSEVINSIKNEFKEYSKLLKSLGCSSYEYYRILKDSIETMFEDILHLGRR